MGIYISKNAIAHNPLPTQVVNIAAQKRPPLESDLLNTPYLQRLASSDFRAQSLKININNPVDAVVRVKAALNIIDISSEGSADNFDITGGQLDTNSGVFDQRLEDAVKEFQTFVNIDVNGVVGPVTLGLIDSYIRSLNRVVLDKTKTVVGEKIVSKRVNIVTRKNTEGKYEYNFRVETKEISFTSESVLPIIPIINSKTESFQFAFTDQQKEIIKEENPDLLPQDFKVLEDAEHLTPIVLGEDLWFESNPNITIDYNSLLQEIGLCAPLFLPEDHADLYLVKNGDNILDKIKEKYYTDAQDITDPFSDTNDVIFTLPDRTNSFPSPERRPYDARLQFYLNLIYYANTPELSGQPILEYAIKKDTNYNRYDNTVLNDFNIYDNELSASDQESAHSNYYRFLKYMEDNGSKIEFDAAGNVTSFNLEPGKYLWLPSRQLADTLYYHLNFRHGEMLVETTDGYEYVTDVDTKVVEIQSSSLWDVLTGTIGAIADYVRDQAVEVFVEAFEFFRATYNYAKNVLNDVISRGVGAELGGEFGITVGAPALDISITKTVWRKMTPKDDFVLKLRENGGVGVGFDIAGGYSVGAKNGSGKNRKAIGVQVGLGASAKIKPNVILEYEFPVRPEENAVLVMLITTFGSAKLRFTTTLLSALNLVNLDPLQYLTWAKLGVAVEGEAWGKGQLSFQENGTDIERKNNVTIPGQPTGIDANKNNGFLNFANIWSKTPSAGVAANLLLALGIEIEYEATYDRKPLVPKIDGRVPSMVKTKNFFFVSGQLNTGAMGGMLKRFFLNLAIGPLLPLLNFENGIGIGFINEYERNTDAASITNADVDYFNADASTTPLQSNNEGKQQFGNANGTWKNQLIISRFTGDVDGLFRNGSESTLKLDTEAIAVALRAGSSDDFFTLNTVQKILGLVYSIELQYKQGLGITTLRQGFASSVFDSMGKIKTGSKADILSYVKNNKTYAFGADIFVGGYLKTEFKVQEFINVLGYFFKRWYLILKYKNNINKRQEIINTTNEKRKVFYSQVASEEEILSKDLYIQLYQELETYLNTELAGEDFNFTDTVKEFFNTVSNYVLEFLNLKEANIYPINAANENSFTWADFEIKQFVTVLAVVTEIIDADAIFELKLGAELRGKLAGGFGAKGRLELMGKGAVIDRSILLKNGLPIITDVTDPWYAVFSEINKLTNTDVTNVLKNGIRKTLLDLPN